MQTAEAAQPLLNEAPSVGMFVAGVHYSALSPVSFGLRLP